MNTSEAKRLTSGHCRSLARRWHEAGRWLCQAAATVVVFFFMQFPAAAGMPAVAKRQVFVRQAPDLSSPVIATLKAGVAVDIEEETGEFARVRTSGGRVGFVRRQNLTVQREETTDDSTSAAPQGALSEHPSPESIAAGQQGPGAPAVAADGGTSRATALQQVNVRKSPDPSSAVVATLKKDVEVTVEQEQGDFVRVRTRANNVGYVRRKYLALHEIVDSAVPESPATIGAAPSAPQEVPATAQPMSVPETEPAVSSPVPAMEPSPPRNPIGTAVTKISLNLRETQDLASPIVATLKKGMVVGLIEDLGDFVLVRTRDGREGYVQRMFLDLALP